MKHPEPPTDEPLRIVPLAAAREHLDDLAAWHGAAWAHLYAGWDAHAARADFARDRGDGTPPFTLLALAGAELLGSVSLVHDDLPGWPAAEPWLGSFLVASHHRGRGIGTALVQAMLAHADACPWPRVLLFTETRQAYFERFGFESIGMHVAEGRGVIVMARRRTDLS
ncbi:MAG TPA: GNAT family N-acetyltransferase [Gammaproteobacteria bacterium]|nr:GNAT family N-acetyltransferase [Gammaproteobacteria bacterium]